jgi:enoyl-CoA hydratase
MNYETILYEKKGGIGTVTMNRPQSMNALNTRLLEELTHVFTEINGDNEIKVAIITGNEKFFGAGADISEMKDIASPLDAQCYFRTVRAAFKAIEDMEEPVIAAVSGLALGGGCEIALACDLRIAAENAVFGLPEIKIGVLPGGGGTQRLPRIIGVTKAKELLFTGDFINAEEAYRIGLVNRVVRQESLMTETIALVSKITRQPKVAVKMIKLAVDGGFNLDIRSAIAYEARCFEILFSTKDQKEGMTAFMAKRKPVFQDR